MDGCDIQSLSILRLKLTVQFQLHRVSDELKRRERRGNPLSEEQNQVLLFREHILQKWVLNVLYRKNRSSGQDGFWQLDESFGVFRTRYAKLLIMIFLFSTSPLQSSNHELNILLHQVFIKHYADRFNVKKCYFFHRNALQVILEQIIESQKQRP